MLTNLLGEDLRQMFFWLVIVITLAGIAYGIIRWGK